MLEMLHYYICYKRELEVLFSVFQNKSFCLHYIYDIRLHYDFPVFKLGKLSFKWCIHIKNIHAHKRGSEQINRSLTRVRVAVEWSISKGSKTTTNQAHH